MRRKIRVRVRLRIPSSSLPQSAAAGKLPVHSRPPPALFVAAAAHTPTAAAFGSRSRRHLIVNKFVNLAAPGAAQLCT
jgi:hypothetical protein